MARKDLRMASTSDPISAAPRGSLPAPIAPPPADDPWVAHAVELVETAINALVADYVAHPFTHRVEHSLHAQLFGLLVANEELSGRHEIGATGYYTGLVHKEWPETGHRVAGSGAQRRRGNFDLVVLAPSQLAQVTDLRQFTAGTIHAPIAIEMGLGYGAVHLDGDVEKFQMSHVPHPYLVHFSHAPSRLHPKTAHAVGRVPSPIKVAYARHDLSVKPPIITIKNLDDTVISVQP